MRDYKGKSLESNICNFTVVDIETTGLSPAKDHIIEIGAAKFECNILVSKFQMLVRPPKGDRGRYVSPEISRITGITDEMLEDAFPVESVLPKFIQYLGADIILGHNINFDINFLYDAKMRLLDKPLTNDYIDTMKLGRKYISQLEHHTLADLADYFGVHNVHAHRALHDAMATAACYLKLQKYIESL